MNAALQFEKRAKFGYEAAAQAVAEVFGSVEGPVTSGDVADYVGLETRDVSAALSYAAKQGHLRKRCRTEGHGHEYIPAGKSWPGEVAVRAATFGSRAIDLKALSPHAINAHFAAHLMETTDGVTVGYDGRERECLAVRPVGVSAIKAVFDRDNYGNAAELIAAMDSVVPGLAAMQGLDVSGAYSELPF